MPAIACCIELLSPLLACVAHSGEVINFNCGGIVIIQHLWAGSAQALYADDGGAVRPKARQKFTLQDPRTSSLFTSIHIRISTTRRQHNYDCGTTLPYRVNKNVIRAKLHSCMPFLGLGSPGRVASARVIISVG